MFPLAILSDIHGNSWALEVVLEDIEKRNIKHIINLGDCLYGPLDPFGTAQMLMKRKIITISGNEDRIIYETSGDKANDQTCAYVRKCLTENEINWLKSQKKIAYFNENILMFHGTFEDDQSYFLHEIFNGQVRLKSETELTKMLQSQKEMIILCAHDHLPNQVRLSSGKLIINPGSVGLQAYTDDIPAEHYIETGSPHTHYSILYRTENSNYGVEQVKLEYDHMKASNKAKQNNRDDWAYWLRTGKAH